MFIKYPKIHRLGKEEVEDILDGEVIVQEKIDGANVSVWLENGEIVGASRNNIKTEGFNGFIDFIKSNEKLISYLKVHPNERLYGEWLVRHTISYNDEAYRKMYLFDVIDNDLCTEENIIFKTQDYVENVAHECGLEYPQIFAALSNPTAEEVRAFVGKTKLGTKGEGIVIKNAGYVNKFGNECYAKEVHQEFKESNSIIFGGNDKHSETYWEMYIVNKYITVGRIQKIMNKIQPTIDKQLDFEHTPRIIGSVYNDMLTEEIWEIQKKVEAVNFRKLARLVQKKAAVIYKDILTNNLSVAYETNNDERVTS